MVGAVRLNRSGGGREPALATVDLGLDSSILFIKRVGIYRRASVKSRSSSAAAVDGLRARRQIGINERAVELDRKETGGATRPKERCCQGSSRERVVQSPRQEGSSSTMLRTKTMTTK